jgi:hypothetical protein
VSALDAASDAALCYTIARYVDDHDRPLAVRRPPKPLAGAIFPALMRANLMILSSVVLRRSALDPTGLAFDERLPVLGCEDWDLWLRIARQSPVVVVPEELTRYRRHDGNTASAQVLAGGLLVAGKHYRDPATAAAARLSLNGAFARLYWYHAGAAGGRARALRLAWRALRSSPASLLSRPALGAIATIALPRAARDDCPLTASCQNRDAWRWRCRTACARGSRTREPESSAACARSSSAARRPAATTEPAPVVRRPGRRRADREHATTPEEAALFGRGSATAGLSCATSSIRATSTRWSACSTASGRRRRRSPGSSCSISARRPTPRRAPCRTRRCSRCRRRTARACGPRPTGASTASTT